MTRDQASQLISDLLKLMVSKNGSDLFITAEFPPAMKIDGVMTRASVQTLKADHTVLLVRALPERPDSVRENAGALRP